MSSFVEQVLLAAGSQEINTTQINEKISEIQMEISKLKQDTKKFIIDNYIEFFSLLKKDQDVIVKAEKVMEEINSLQKRVDDQIKINLKGSTKELQTLSNSLKELKHSLIISNNLLDVHKYRLSTKKALQDNQYIEAAKMLHSMHEILFNLKTDVQNLDIIEPLKIEYLNLHSQLCTNMYLLWQENVCQEETMINDGKITKFKPKKIEMYMKNRDSVNSLIKAMSHVEDMEICIQEFCKKLLTLFIKPIILNDCKVYIKDSKSNSVDFCLTFTVEILKEVAEFNYKCIFHNLDLLFKYVVDYFDLTSTENKHVLDKLYKYLYPELSKTLINDCVAKTIPTSSSELNKFASTRDEIIAFENQLIKYGIISSDSRYLTEYVTNVDNLYIQKIRQGYLSKAKEIMKKDLHDNMKYIPKEPLKIPSETLDNYTLNISNRALSKSTFQLPECQISKSTKEILDLIVEILDETCKNTNDFAVRLFYTSRDIIEMYIGLVPLHHKHFLDTIPQQVALFHNNCLYLAHHLLTLAFKYENKLPAELRKHNLNYVDQVLILRNLGTEYFLNQMMYQRDIIIDILRDSDLSKIGQLSQLPKETEKQIRQCIRQLELLKTVWLHILPEKVYCRAIGCIVNAMVEDLITKVTSIEDISADVATDLVSLYNLVIRRVPAIFPEPDKIKQHVRKWSKLKELIVILDAPLIEIEERWGKGKGPLAEEFSPDHVKQLIKALFQNTDRRSALLSKIK